MGRFTVQDALRKPEFLAGCLGLALCLCMRDLPQFLLFDAVSGVSSSQYLLAVGRAVPMVALAFLAQRAMRASQGSNGVLGLAYPFVAAGAVLEVIGICLRGFVTIDVLNMLGFFVLGVGQSLLVSGWVVPLVELGRRGMFIALMFALCAAGLIEVVFALMTPFAAFYLALLLPLLSAALFVVAGGSQKGGVAFATVMALRGSGDDAGSGDSLEAPAVPAGRTLLVLLTFFSYSFIARELTDTWMAHGTNETLFVFQLCGGVGTACAAFVVYLAFRLRRAYKNSAVYTVFAIFALTVAVYLSTFLIDVWSALFLVPLWVLRKLILFLAVATAHGLGGGARSVRMFGWAFAFVEAGNVCQTVFFDASAALGVAGGVLTPVVLLALIVFIVVVEWSEFLRVSHGSGDTFAEVPVGMSAGGGVSDQSDISSVSPMERAVCEMTERYQLSVREAEVLGYLAVGRNAEYIARTLGVAPSTIKTHIAHIYRKTGHNSQQRLMDTLDELVSELEW